MRTITNTADFAMNAHSALDIDLSLPPAGPGASGFAADVRRLAEQAQDLPARRFIGAAGERYANIRPGDWTQPRRFLRQLSGRPPVRFGTQSFQPALVDDQDPARHYTAFVVVGYWLPRPLAVATLWAWEILGFVRYRGTWSQPDLRLGFVGLRHGARVRREGARVLARLVQRELVA